VIPSSVLAMWLGSNSIIVQAEADFASDIVIYYLVISLLIRGKGNMHLYSSL
jgi:hypothetical protein